MPYNDTDLKKVHIGLYGELMGLGSFIYIFSSLFLQILGAAYFISSLFSWGSYEKEIIITNLRQLRCEVLPMLSEDGKAATLAVPAALMADENFKAELYGALRRCPFLSARIIH